jgi:hypothetical protein
MQFELSNHNFQTIIHNNDTDDAINDLSDVLYTTNNNCCPIKTKTLSLKAELKPWITNAICSNNRKRNAYHILYMQNIIPQHLFKKIETMLQIK